MFTRYPEGYRGERSRRGLLAAVVALTLVYLALTGLSSVWTDYLWFDSVGYTGVWRTNLLATLLLGAFGAVLVFLVIWGNLSLADRLAPRYELIQFGDDDELVQRFREWAEPRLRLVRLGIAAAFALLVGLTTTAWRDDLLLFLNARSFGTTDPLFDTDVGFYLFRLPLWSDLVGWLFNLAALTTVLVVAVYYLNGGIRLRRETGLSMRFSVKAHVSVLVAVTALIRALMYRIDAYELVYSNTGAAFGAGYTDVNARLPALTLLALVSVVAAALFIANIWRVGWTLAVVSVGSWLFVSFAAGLIYPTVVQRFQVEPNELLREEVYIGRNIQATREAFGLAEVEVRNFAATRGLTATDVSNNRPTIDNVRLWDPGVLTRTYQNLQELRQYYRVDRVDVDRYRFGDEIVQMMVAPRELDEGNLPATDWQNTRLIYTHGFGAVASAANEVQPDGQPRFLLRDVPPVSEHPELALELQPRVYFGETYEPGRPVIVRTGNREGGQEVDYPLADEGQALNQYEGEAGVAVGDIFRRVAFALRYRDLNILISGQIRPDSRVLMERNIRSMVQKVTPFLVADSNPYPVVHDGRLVWMMDMYSVSNRYPYSRPLTFADTRRLRELSRMPAGVNYIRNPVKVVVDAYDGTIDFYVVDPDDPVLAAWASVYPGVFQPMSEMPPDLVEHIRYPEDLFVLQSEMYLLYHMREEAEFFRQDDAWAIPEDPSDPRRIDLLRGDQRDLSAPDGVRYLQEMMPYYLLMKLPGEEDLSYVMAQPFSPKQRRNMVSFLLADSTPGEGRYGRLVDLRMPRERVVEGPGQVGDRIQQDSEIATQFSLWDQQGSEVLLGDLLVVPIEESVVYVMPVYLAAQEGGLPEFRRAIVVFGDRIEWRTTLDGALQAVFQGDTGAEQPGGGGGEEPAPISGTVQELLERAADAFARAEEALRTGDLAEYQRLIQEAQQLVEEARQQLDLPEDSGEAGRRLPLG